MKASVFDFDSCSFTHQFKLNFLETEKVTIGHSVSSEDIFAGGHLWRIRCYPRGDKKEDKGKWISIFLHHASESKDAKAIFEAFIIDKDGSPSCRRRLLRVFEPTGCRKRTWGWCHFVERSILESLCVTNGSFIIMCGAKVVLDDDPLEAPPSDIASHLGFLLDSAEGSDVSFVVDGEKFHAHRAVLAARSPVFKAQLLGSMADAKMPSITLHDIEPATIRVLLRFIYTDVYPEEDELGDTPYDMVRHLLAAADRFALDRLKILCAADLWDNISVDTVAETLICAEAYNCPQLKKKCIDFIVEEKNFKKVVVTDDYIHLGQQFPSILDELRVKVGA